MPFGQNNFESVHKQVNRARTLTRMINVAGKLSLVREE